MTSVTGSAGAEIGRLRGARGWSRAPLAQECCTAAGVLDIAPREQLASAVRELSQRLVALDPDEMRDTLRRLDDA